jgi:hypothetical protein
MANRTFQQFQNSLEKGLVHLIARVSVAGGGAVTLQKWNPASRTYTSAPTSGVGSYSVGSQGIKTVARTGTGAWTIVLQDSYNRLVDAWFTSTAASGTTTVIAMGVDAATDVTSATAPTIKVLLNSATATAADPASGDKIDLHFVLQNSGSV